MKNYNVMPISLVVNEKLIKEDISDEVNVSLYRSIIENLLYLTTIRLDIMFTSSLFSKFMQKPSKIHFGATKRVLRYIKGTKNYGIMYERSINNNIKLFRFCDSD